MEWITKIINNNKYDTNIHALKNAIWLIDKWCRQNNFSYEILHNEDTGCNRVLTIYTPHKTYQYKFIISSCNVENGYEEGIDFFGNKCKQPIYKAQYYAKLTH